MRLKTFLLPMLCGLAGTGAALADTTTPVDPATIDVKQRMSMAYVDQSFTLLKDLVDPGDVLKLVLVTKQEVLAAMCEGFEIDNDKLTTVLNTVLAKPMAGGNPDSLVFGRVMHGYGVLKGGEMALATYDPDAYCTYGIDLRAQFQTEEGGEAVNVLKPAG